MGIAESDTTEGEDYTLSKSFVLYDFRFHTFDQKKGLFNQEQAIRWLRKQGLEVESREYTGEEESPIKFLNKGITLKYESFAGGRQTLLKEQYETNNPNLAIVVSSLDEEMSYICEQKIEAIFKIRHKNP